MSISNDLRQAILQAAIQGKLTKQLPEDGNAKDLLEQIKAEKAKLVKEGKLKKEKPLPEITEDEIPFDIPGNWEWCRIGEVSTYGHTKKKINAQEAVSNMWLLDLEDIEKGGKLLQKKTVSESKAKGEKTFFEKGNILYSKLRPYLLKVLEADDNGICTPELVPFGMYGKIDNQYVIDFLKSPYVDIEINQLTYGVKMPRVGTETMLNFLIPLPPLSEQKRIVAKVEELMAKIDELEKTEKELNALKKAFPADMKASLLQAAMQGKLTEQLPEDGNAKDLLEQIKAEKAKLVKEGKMKKEKPLPEITEDEIPFDIPENWEWVRLNQVLDVRDGTHDTPKYVSVGVPLVTSKNLCDGTINFENAKLISFEDAEAINIRSNVDDGDILFAMIGSIGNPVLVKKDREFSIKNMGLFKSLGKDFLDMKYLLFFLEREQQNMKSIASGGVQSFVSLGFLRNYIMPLPPLAEQKRIVEKLEKLLPLCDGLK